MLPLQPRPLPRHRSVGRERIDGRNPAARVRARIPRLHPPRQDRGSNGGGTVSTIPATPSVISRLVRQNLIAERNLKATEVPRSGLARGSSAPDSLLLGVIGRYRYDGLLA